MFDKNGGPIVYKEVPVPKPKSNELLIHVLYTGVCHTDLHAWKGDWPLPVKLPLIGGHEGAGVVVAMGSEVKNWKIGDFAGIKWLNGSCMSCEFCMQGAEPNCPMADLSGYTHDGSFAQYATADAVQAARIRQTTKLDEVAPILCAGVTVYKALKTADLRPGQWVAISGAGGGLGSLAIQYAKAMGLRVLAIDGGDDKAKLCTDLGAEVFVDFTKSKDIIKDVVAATHGGHTVSLTSLCLREPFPSLPSTSELLVRLFLLVCQQVPSASPPSSTRSSSLLRLRVLTSVTERTLPRLWTSSREVWSVLHSRLLHFPHCLMSSSRWLRVRSWEDMSWTLTTKLLSFLALEVFIV